MSGEAHAERRLLLWLLVYAMATYCGAYVIGGATANALFLSRLAERDIASRYLLRASLSIAAIVICRRLESRARIDRVVLLTTAASLLLTLLLRFLIGVAPTAAPVLWATYASVEMMGGLAAVQVWNMADQIFEGRIARRRFGLVAGACGLAFMLGGYIINKMSAVLRTPDLLIGLVVAQVLALIAAARVSALARLPKPRVDPLPPLHVELPALWGTPLLRSLSLVVTVEVVLVNLVDCELALSLKRTFAEPAVAGYLGQLNLRSGAAACAVQFLLAGGILVRFGTLISLLVLPLALAAALAWVIVSQGALPALALARGIELSLGWLFVSALHLLYAPLRRELRGRARAAIEGLVAPLAVAVAGALMLALLPLRGLIPSVALALCGAWIALLIQAQRRYVAALGETLRLRQASLSTAPILIQADGARRFVARLLEDLDPRRVLHGFDVLASSGAPAAWDRQVASLLSHPFHWVRIRALRHLGRPDAVAHGTEVARLLGDTQVEVAAEAIATLARIYGPQATPLLLPYLSDGNRLLRVAAARVLLLHGDAGGVAAARADVLRLLRSGDGALRTEAARLVGALRLGALLPWLLPLLEDPDAEVQRAAIEAAGALGGSRVVAILTGLLSQRKTAGIATSALLLCGLEADEPMARLVVDEGVDLSIRRHAARVLGRLGTPRGLDALLQAVEASPDLLRTAAAKELARLQDLRPGTLSIVAPGRLAGLLEAEARAALRWTAMALDLALPQGSVLAGAAARSASTACSR